MAATDAFWPPRKNVAWRVTFTIETASTRLPVTGATGLDSEISKDGGTFTDCTNEATEIATNSGVYFLDLTATEMNADTVAILVKTSSVGAFAEPIIVYPQEVADCAFIADAVWDEPWADHEVADTFGEIVVNQPQLSDIISGTAVAVWEEQLGDHSGTSGSTAEALDAIGPTLASLPANTAGDLLDANFEQDGEAGVTVAEGLRMTTAALAGKLSGAGTGTETVRNILDTKDRLVYAVDSSGNRTLVVRDLS